MSHAEPGESWSFFFQAEDGIRDLPVTGVQTCALPISDRHDRQRSACRIFGFTQGQTRIFDKLIFACHADQALRILQDPSPLHQEILSRFRYQPTRVIVHTDPAVLPKNRRRWAGWNYLADYDANNNLATSFTYYLNRLQKVSTRSDFFVTINDTGKVDK